ncbi:MAG TPA: hypothetical protein DEO84_02675 [candidate division Zixibacteria bacterium]|nr:hypothetical protein [candidate division Zixibacteria bacterium]HBZ00203.1 hypothetical protein [candidate division Zixibacteria bacterium]
MRKTIFFALVISLIAVNAYSDEDAGLGGQFLRNGIGARPLGMGGAYTAIAEGPEATYYNPAGLGFNLRLGISLSYKSMSLDRHLSHAAISFPIRNEAAMAASWVNAGVGNVTGHGASQQLAGKIDNNQNAFAVSFAKAINNTFAFGGTLRYLQEKFDNLDAFAIGVDLGAKARIKKVILVGLTAQNLGSTMRWDSGNYWGDGGSSYNDEFPVVVRFGLAGNLLNDKFVPAIDFEKSGKMAVRFRAGAEYWLTKRLTKQVEDEYEEGKFNAVEYSSRWAGLRMGIDRGNLTFGASYAYVLKNTSMAIEYAFLVGQQGTSASHIFTLKVGL